MHPTSITGIILIVLVALLLFGPNKLPELGRAFGKTLREFKNGAKTVMDDEDDDKKPQLQQRKDITPDVNRMERIEDAEVKTESLPADQPKPQERDNRRLPD